MDIQAQRELALYSILQRAWDIQIVSGNLVQSTKWDHKLSVALMNGTKNKQLKEVFLTEVETVIQNLVMRRNIECAMLNKSPTLSLQNAASRKVMDHTTIWTFMRRALERF